MRTVGSIGHLDTGRFESVADLIGLRPVPTLPGVVAPAQFRTDEDVDRLTTEILSIVRA